MTDVLLFFAPFCVVTVAGTFVLNRVGWRLSRVLSGIALALAINVVEFEVAWRLNDYRTPPFGATVLLTIADISHPSDRFALDRWPNCS